ncbi:MAG: GDSL-type esterase/lipase family protein [Planctomycetaceae bacterium]
MAWPGDTTHVRLRPLNYGSFEENLAKQNPTVVMASYGVNDAFEGTAQLEKFLNGYRETLTTFANLKLHTPDFTSPFESIPGAPYDLEQQNKSLQEYVNATGQLAQESNISFVNLFQPNYHPDAPTPYPLTDNGLHFTEFGYWKVSQSLAEQLGYGTEEWSVEISAGKRKVNKTGVRIRDLQSSSTAVSFAAIDDRLPLAPR